MIKILSVVVDLGQLRARKYTCAKATKWKHAINEFKHIRDLKITLRFLLHDQHAILHCHVSMSNSDFKFLLEDFIVVFIVSHTRYLKRCSPRPTIDCWMVLRIRNELMVPRSARILTVNSNRSFSSLGWNFVPWFVLIFSFDYIFFHRAHASFCFSFWKRELEQWPWITQ